MLPEMRSLWGFIVIAIAIIVINFIYMPILWAAISSAVLIVIGAFIFRNDLILIKSNLNYKYSSRRVESIISNLSDGIIAYDNDFKIILFNPAAGVIFNLQANLIIGKRLDLRMRRSRYAIAHADHIPFTCPGSAKTF